MSSTPDNLYEFRKTLQATSFELHNWSIVMMKLSELKSIDQIKSSITDPMFWINILEENKQNLNKNICLATWQQSVKSFLKFVLEKAGKFIS